MDVTDLFTSETLLKWKRDHERRVRHGAAIPTFESRKDLNDQISGLLNENSGIWRTLGPESSAAEEPLSEAAAQWRDRVRNTIVPNNRRVLELVDANRSLLRADEFAVVEDFRVHAAAFDMNNMSDQRRANAPRFPTGFPLLFTDPRASDEGSHS